MNLRKAGMATLAAGAVAVGPLVLPGGVAQAQTTPSPRIGSVATLPSPQLANRGTTRVCAGIARDRCMAEVVTTAPGSSKALVTGSPAGYGPADFAAAYHLPAATVGSTNTIAILDEGAFPTLETDLNTYRAQYGLPACTAADGCFKQVGEHGGAPLAPGKTANEKDFDEQVGLETALDVDMASAACPTCHILEITVNRDLTTSEDKAAEDFGVAMNTAASLGASAASVSYQFDPDATLDLGQAARDFYHPGMAITASSGDGGFEGTPSGWPQNLPTVTSVGGTALYRTPGADPSGYSEVAWDGSGSGCAAELPPALGQPTAISADCAGHRGGSDISADADPTTGAAVYDDYTPFSGSQLGWLAVGGTSESSPYVAGLYARGGHVAEVEGPDSLYAAPSSAFNDITAGQNAAPNSGCTVLCISGPGWDGPTGLGTPNGLAAFQ
ncbi:S53 family peptidase [Streptacidiphilus melanogenes]|uniref:S53 family peptidase n=1 Tax=Streptacidiphilus melanogenes TaxID=411235 RepID=UPI0005A88C2C|nr:S8 family serine peptidase [Streptacidiphilus melanogenes]